jgi:putative component of membrane protein insertase Oxa1/YidC/SpoIIIJ protein YidD
MNLRTITYTIILLAAFANQAASQSSDEIRSFRGLLRPAMNNPDYSLNIDPTNEFRLILTGGFAFYKTFVSSQDGMVCTFYPSCSSYAIGTIQTNGLLGILDAIDRLTRCNGLSPEKYPIHEHSQRYYDPVPKITH